MNYPLNCPHTIYRLYKSPKTLKVPIKFSKKLRIIELWAHFIGQSCHLITFIGQRSNGLAGISSSTRTSAKSLDKGRVEFSSMLRAKVWREPARGTGDDGAILITMATCLVVDLPPSING